MKNKLFNGLRSAASAVRQATRDMLRRAGRKPIETKAPKRRSRAERERGKTPRAMSKEEAAARALRLPSVMVNSKGEKYRLKRGRVPGLRSRRMLNNLRRVSLCRIGKLPA